MGHSSKIALIAITCFFPVVINTSGGVRNADKYPVWPSRLPRQGVHDVDRPAHVQALAQPARSRRPRVEAEPLRLVPRPEGLDGIGGDCSGRRHLGQESPVRAPEPEHAVRLSIHLVALLVDRAVVPATEQGEVRERGRAALRPVADVMPLAEREPAAGKAATPVAVVEYPP